MAKTLRKSEKIHKGPPPDIWENVQVGDIVKLEVEPDSGSHGVPSAFAAKFSHNTQFTSFFEEKEIVILRKYWKISPVDTKDYRSYTSNSFQMDSNFDPRYMIEYMLAVADLRSEKHKAISCKIVKSWKKREVDLTELLTCENTEVRELFASVRRFFV